jgi:5,10-methylene-tetrahydrofolate dehydrogenase/methenyl tetrahydrofolate cyclohydrolase
MEKITSTSDTKPRFALIQIGENEDVNAEIADFKEECEIDGIVFSWYFFPEDINTEELIFELEELAPFEDGLMLVSPKESLMNIDEEKLMAALARLEEQVVGSQRPERRGTACLW